MLNKAYPDESASHYASNSSRKSRNQRAIFAEIIGALYNLNDILLNWYKNCVFLLLGPPGEFLLTSRCLERQRILRAINRFNLHETRVIKPPSFLWSIRVVSLFIVPNYRYPSLQIVTLFQLLLSSNCAPWKHRFQPSDSRVYAPTPPFQCL